MASTAANISIPKGKALAFMLVVLFASNMNASFSQSLMNVALDQVATDYGVRLSEANWVVLGYAIVTATVITMAASLLKRYGLRKMMAVGYLATFVGSLLGVFAINFPMLVAARLIQAITTGLCFPIINEALLRLSPPGRAGVLLSVNSGIIGVGLAFSPPIAGFVITYLGLKVLFLIPAIFSVIIAIVAYFGLHDIYEHSPVPIDGLSVVLSLGGLAAFMGGLNEITHVFWPALASMAVAAVIIALFVWRQNSLKEPLLNLSPLRVPVFTLGEILVVLCFMGSMYLSLLAPLYLEGAAKQTSFEAGCMLIVPILCYSGLCFASGKILAKHGVWPLVSLGVLIILCGYVAMNFAASSLQIGAFLVCAAVAYGGIGLMFPATKSVNLEELPAEVSAHGSSIHSTLVQVASSIASALFVGIMSSDVATAMAQGVSKADAYGQGFSHTLIIEIGFLVAALVVSFVYTRLVQKSPLAQSHKS